MGKHIRRLRPGLDNMLDEIAPQYLTSGPSLDGFIQQREHILKVKLEINARQIRKRVEVRREQLDDLLRQEVEIDTRLLELESIKNYEWNRQRDFYQQLFQLQQERRRIDADCWRDVAMVMRDFLAAWEADQQAKSRWGLLRS